jgi:hypothetical protein
MCRNLTDASIKVIAEHCPGICGLDLSNVCKLTDLSMGYLTNGCRALHTLKLCRNPFRCLFSLFPILPLCLWLYILCARKTLLFSVPYCSLTFFVNFPLLWWHFDRMVIFVPMCCLSVLFSSSQNVDSFSIDLNGHIL